MMWDEESGWSWFHPKSQMKHRQEERGVGLTEECRGEGKKKGGNQ